MKTTMDKAKSKKKFRKTKALIKIALENGWTQNQIAKKCRTHQSIVSDWANGQKYATIQQIKPLLEAFGNQLERKTSKVYYSFSEKDGYKYFKIEGPIIFAHTLRSLVQIDKIKKIIPELRILIHDQNNSFILIFQTRVFKSEYNFIENEKANWNSQINEHNSIEELISRVEAFSTKISNNYKQDSIALPYLIRESLSQHGYKVEDIVEYPISW